MTLPEPFPSRLVVVGFWAGPEAIGNWPHVEDFLDPSWDSDERDFIQHYLDTGLIARGCMGYSRCRLCGKENGNLDLTDGHYLWPEGLGHYVSDHSVRLPREFVDHAMSFSDALFAAERDGAWWTGARLAGDPR